VIKMDQKTKIKIRAILNELGKAQEREEMFYGKQIVPGKKIVPHDFFEMALAFDNKSRLFIEYRLALCDAFPGRCLEREIKYLKKREMNLQEKSNIGKIGNSLVKESSLGENNKRKEELSYNAAMIKEKPVSSTKVKNAHDKLTRLYFKAFNDFYQFDN